MSTASVYPEPMAAGFSIAAELGYDGVELMVWNERGSQQLRSVARHSERTGMPADGKLRVGDVVLEVNGVPVRGVSQVDRFGRPRPMCAP